MDWHSLGMALLFGFGAFVLLQPGREEARFMNGWAPVVLGILLGAWSLLHLGCGIGLLSLDPPFCLRPGSGGYVDPG